MTIGQVCRIKCKYTLPKQTSMLRRCYVAAMAPIASQPVHKGWLRATLLREPLPQMTPKGPYIPEGVNILQVATHASLSGYPKRLGPPANNV
jgi:hypothetical protein